MTTFTMAAAQTTSRKGDIDANVQVHVELVRAAARHHVDVIVFPELSLTGYEPKIARDVTMRADDGRLQPLKKLAQQFDMTIVAGAPVGGSGGKPYIGALILRPDSSRVYAKQFLHSGEDEFFSPGTEGCVIDVKGAKVALAICADTTHPVHARRAAQNGATIYAAGVLITDDGYAPDARQLQQYAAEHRMTVLMANHCSPTGGYRPAGKSAIWDNSGTLLATADRTGESLVVAVEERGSWAGTAIRV